MGNQKEVKNEIIDKKEEKIEDILIAKNDENNNLINENKNFIEDDKDTENKFIKFENKDIK